MGMDALADAGTRSMLLLMREQGYSLMLRGAHGLPKEPAVLELITHLDVGTGEPQEVAAIRRDLPAGHAQIKLMATRLQDWDAFDACAAQRLDVLVDGGYGRPPVKEGGDAELQPEAMLIVRLMQMLQRNEDARQIESALKRDAALTYRLLRHINSPAIGAGVEITSLRHAVAMFGYGPLFRWLLLLLATSNKANSPFMMKKAITRGRFVELIGQGMLPPGESDNLFVVGMFSLIDQVLGVPMREMLTRVQLAESVQQAILERKGVYAPFLSLVEACERNDGLAARLAETLFMSARQVNAAHLEALVWSQEISAVEAA
jgi:EAL and modified HD-GYP domain-containing signal transduction protein